MKENNILDKSEKALIASFMGFSKSGKQDFSNICDSEKQCFLDECNYLSWEYLMPVLEKFTRDFEISWTISSDYVRIGEIFETNCPNIVICAYRAAISNIIKINNK